MTFAHGFGTKGPNSQDPVDANTLFRIGSMTKALTATALLGLVHEGTINLDAPLISVVPDVAITGSSDLAALTIRQLLSHQSGLYDYGVLDGPTDDGALSRFLTSPSFAANEYFMDPPGTFYNYANPNFALAGLALERAGGVSYRQAVAERVLSPLKMTRTFFRPSEVIADGNFSDGASTTPAGDAWDVTPDAYDNAWLRPAGYAFSSVLDYAKFVQFLYAGNATVLPDGERDAMQTPQVNMLDIGGASADIESYGFGLVIDRAFQVGSSAYLTKLVWHNGSLAGLHELVLPGAVDRLRDRLARERRRRAIRRFCRSRDGELRRTDEPHHAAAGGRRDRSEPVSELRRDLRRSERARTDDGHRERNDAVD